jgi:hypothetical protein
MVEHLQAEVREQFVEPGLACGEVQIEGALRNARGRGDALHRGISVAELAHHARGRHHQLLPVLRRNAVRPARRLTSALRRFSSFGSAAFVVPYGSAGVA